MTTADLLSAAREPSPTALAGLTKLHRLTLGDPRICVAILDGPVDKSHPCFAGATLVDVETLVDPAADRGGALAHGTHVASVIFGQPGTSVAGIAPRCRGLILPVFASAPQGGMILCSQIDLARAIELAIAHGAHVINISGGQLTPDGEAEPVLAGAIRSCVDNNVLLIAAAGNDGCDCLHLPAADASVLTVGAMDDSGQPLDFSNWGAAYRDQGILAPGRNVRGAAPGGGVTSKSGTSFAAPIVSGIAALLLSEQLARGMRPDPAAVRAALLESATPCDPSNGRDCRRFLKGAVNPDQALAILVKGESKMNIGNTLIDTSSATVVPSETVAYERPPAAPQIPAAPVQAAVIAAELAPQTAPSETVPLSAAPSPAVAASAVAPSDCGCGGGKTCSCGGGANCTCGTPKTAQLVYALGTPRKEITSSTRSTSARAPSAAPTRTVTTSRSASITHKMFSSPIASIGSPWMSAT